MSIGAGVSEAGGSTTGEPDARGPDANPPKTRDDRALKASRVTRALKRPEFGALMGAVAVFLIFTFLDATPNHIWLTQTGVASWALSAHWAM